MAADLNDRLPSPEGAPLLCGGNPRCDLMIDFMGKQPGGAQGERS
jgi:hypothetical protein